MNLIDVDAFLEKYCEYCKPNPRIYQAMTIVFKRMPTVELPVRHGRWVGNDRHTSCSVCGQTYCIPDEQEGHLDMTFYKYCPNCGAKMEK